MDELFNAVHVQQHKFQLNYFSCIFLPIAQVYSYVFVEAVWVETVCLFQAKQVNLPCHKQQQKTNKKPHHLSPETLFIFYQEHWYLVTTLAIFVAILKKCFKGTLRAEMLFLNLYSILLPMCLH